MVQRARSLAAMATRAVVALTDGSFLGIMDAGMIKAWVDQAIKDQGATKMNYITAPVAQYVP